MPNSLSVVVGRKLRQITVGGAVTVTVGSPGSWTVTVTVTARWAGGPG